MRIRGMLTEEVCEPERARVDGVVGVQRVVHRKWTCRRALTVSFPRSPRALQIEKHMANT